MIEKSVIRMSRGAVGYYMYQWILDFGIAAGPRRLVANWAGSVPAARVYTPIAWARPDDHKLQFDYSFSDGTNVNCGSIYLGNGNVCSDTVGYSLQIHLINYKGEKMTTSNLAEYDGFRNGTDNAGGGTYIGTDPALFTDWDGYANGVQLSLQLVDTWEISTGATAIITIPQFCPFFVPQTSVR